MLCIFHNRRQRHHPQTYHLHSTTTPYCYALLCADNNTWLMRIYGSPGFSVWMCSPSTLISAWSAPGRQICFPKTYFTATRTIFVGLVCLLEMFVTRRRRSRVVGTPSGCWRELIWWVCFCVWVGVGWVACVSPCGDISLSRLSGHVSDNFNSERHVR